MARLRRRLPGSALWDRESMETGTHEIRRTRTTVSSSHSCGTRRRCEYSPRLRRCCCRCACATGRFQQRLEGAAGAHTQLRLSDDAPPHALASMRVVAPIGRRAARSTPRVCAAPTLVLNRLCRETAARTSQCPHQPRTPPTHTHTPPLHSDEVLSSRTRPPGLPARGGTCWQLDCVALLTDHRQYWHAHTSHGAVYAFLALMHYCCLCAQMMDISMGL